MCRQMVCPRCWGTKKDPGYVKSVPCVRCDGKGQEKNVQLSDHFWLGEFLESPTAMRKGVSNDSIGERELIVQRLTRVANELLEPIRKEFGPVTINSGYRTEEVNKAIGGSKTSAHCHAWAADIDPLEPRVKHYDVVKWVVKKKLPYDQVIYEGTWIHLGLFGPRDCVRGEALMMFPERREVPGKKPRLVSRYYPWDAKDERVVL